MVQNRWSDEEAEALVAEYGAAVGEDLALRVYTSRLLGRDPGLVLHGGGNTSCKVTIRDAFGAPMEAIAVKGSGWDLASIEPRGLPLLELAPLRRLLDLPELGDTAMVNEVRRRLLDAAAPNPSVEAILHAALPHRFVDHTHADVVLVLSNQPDGAALLREVYGDRVAVLPWTMPGFPLARAVAAAIGDHPGIEGVVLMQHGIFTFGDDARQSYDRMIDLVTTAERYVAARVGAGPAMLRGSDGAAANLAGAPDLQRMIQTVRGGLAFSGGAGPPTRMVCSYRGDPDLVAFSAHPECRRLVELGPITPDHVIRTKGRYLFLNREQALDPIAVRQAVAAYASWYQHSFATHKKLVVPTPVMTDPQPRVVVVAGRGVLAFGEDAAAARIAGDIAAHTLRAKALGEAIGAYQELPPEQLFAMEYWPLERAKLGAPPPGELRGQVALVTGGAGGIGYGVCEALVESGAAVAICDIDAGAVDFAVESLAAAHPGAAVLGVVMDVTDAESVRAGFGRITEAFGGVDIVVPNAGIAHVSKLRDMDPAAFRRVLDVNLTGTLTVLHEAALVFEAQGTGGAVVVQASKNVFAPGAAFGAYSASKAGQHQLGKIAAIEFAAMGVRVNMINADAVFGDKVASGLWAEVGPDRMKSRGLDEQGLKDYYRSRSLLEIPVTPRHVGDAVVFLASHRSAATTGVTLTVDGGVAGAFPR